MTQTTTATTNFDKTVNTLIRKTLELELLPSLPHLSDNLGFIQASFVKGTNSTMRFLRIPFLTLQSDSNISGHSAGTAPWLTEGTAPAAQALAFGYQEFTAYQAGQRVEITDVALDEADLGSGLASEASVRVARQAAATIDNYVAQVLAAGTSVIYAGGQVARANVGLTDTVTGSLIRRAAQGMKFDSIPMFGDGTFHAVVNPAVVFDFEEDEALGGWKAIGTYNDGAANTILAGELGKYAGVRFVESPSARIFAAAGAGGADVYSTYICGPDSFAFGDWGNITTHVVLPGGHGDELAQVMSIGWKCRFGALLTDSAGARYVRIESGATSI
jgi:N4-gp56 family major capsid protein